MRKKTPIVTKLLKPQSTDPLLSPFEAAVYLGVEVSTLSVWRCTGRYNIEFIKVGRLVKYRKSSLDAFLEQRTQVFLLNDQGV